MEALKLMNARKAAGLSGVMSELLRVCKKESVKRMAKVANNFLSLSEGKKMPKSWEE